MKKYTKHLIILSCILTFIIAFCCIPIGASRLIPIIEEQVGKELGINIHIERLILRFGPSLKLKTPLMHVMYKDGQKFAQFNSVKFYVPWSVLFKDTFNIKDIKAQNFILKIASNDENFDAFLNTLNKKSAAATPNIYFKDYNIIYKNSENNDIYSLKGNNLELNKQFSFNNYKIKTKGMLSINSKNHISYDLVINPNLDLTNLKLNIDFLSLLEQIKLLDFHSDIITDLKIYKANDNSTQYSGFINIDNISVLDELKKNPKSFIYLTLWGNKASILSNIYTSQSKKVYLEGVIKNTDKPVLDLKVKTDEIYIAELYKKMKIFTNLSIFKEVKKLDGILSADFTLKGDLNKLKSNGYVKINNALIDANGLKINNINSEIDLSNNKININKATGYVNNSPIIIRGSIDKEIDLEFLMDKVQLKNLTPQKYGITSGVVSLIAKISGTLDNIIHKEILSIEDLKLNYNKLDLTIESIKLDTNKNNVAYIKNILCKNSISEPIKIPSLNLFINSDSIKMPDTNIYMQNSMLTAKADAVKINNIFNYVLNIDGFINSKDLTAYKLQPARYPVKLNINGNNSMHNVLAQILFEKTNIFDEPVVLNLNSKFEKENIKIEDLSLYSFSGIFSKDLKQNIKGNKKISINGNIDKTKEINFKNLRIFLPQVLNLNLYESLTQIKGDIFINGNIKKPEIIGQLSLQNLINQNMQLNIHNCILDFNKNNIVVNAPQFKLGDSVFNINALLATDLEESILIKNINIKSKFLNTNTLLMYKDSPLLKNLPITILDGKFYSEKMQAEIYDSQLYLSAFSSNFKLNNQKLILKDISSELYNGKLGGNIDYDLKNEHFTTNIHARNVSAEPIFNIISTKKDSISGTLNFDSNIVGELTSKQSLNGNIKFIVNNGRMATLGKLEHLLYAQNVLADNMLRTTLSVVLKAITLKDTGLFKYLQGDVDIDNGIANIKMLQSQGPLMALFIKGHYNLLSDYANLVVLGRLSDEIINGLGAFGDFSFNKLMIMLTGEEQKSNIITEDFEKIPQLPVKNTKEFRSIINGIIDKPSSVVLFNWISYSQKSYKQKEVPLVKENIPDFVESLPY